MIELSDSYSVIGQEISNPFFQIDTSSTFTFIWSEDIANNDAVLEEIYNALYAYNSQGSIADLEKAVSAARSDLEGLSGTLDALKATSSKLDEFSEALSRLGSLRSDIEAFRESVQKVVLLPSSYSASIRQKLSELTDALINELTLNLPIDIGGHGLDALKSALDSVEEICSDIQSQIQQCSNALKNKSSDEYTYLLFSLIGANGSAFATANGDTGSPLLSFNSIVELDANGVFSSLDSGLLAYLKAGSQGSLFANCTSFSDAVTAAANNQNMKNAIVEAVLTVPLDTAEAAQIAADADTAIAAAKSALRRTIVDSMQSTASGLHDFFTARINAALAAIDAAKNNTSPSLANSIRNGTREAASIVIGDHKDIYNSTMAELKTLLSSQVSKAESDIKTKETDYNNAVKDLENALQGDAAASLLKLALRYNPADGKGVRITKIGQLLGGGYTVRTGDATTSETSLNTATAHLNVAYFALAMCCERALVIQETIAAQVKEIEKINEKIRINNEFLKKLNQLYSATYKGATANRHPSGPDSENDQNYRGDFTGSEYSVNVNGVATPLNTYLSQIGAEKLVGATVSGNFTWGSANTFYFGFYTSDGTCSATYGSWADANAHIGGGEEGKTIENIDVIEQGQLTQISNAQEAVRMNGDSLSTDSQMMSTKLTQFTQNYNSFFSVASQICKATADYFKSVASNIR